MENRKSQRTTICIEGFVNVKYAKFTEAGEKSRFQFQLSKQESVKDGQSWVKNICWYPQVTVFGITQEQANSFKDGLLIEIANGFFALQEYFKKDGNKGLSYNIVCNFTDISVVSTQWVKEAQGGFNPSPQPFPTAPLSKPAAKAIEPDSNDDLPF